MTDSPAAKIDRSGVRVSLEKTSTATKLPVVTSCVDNPPSFASASDSVPATGLAPEKESKV